MSADRTPAAPARGAATAAQRRNQERVERLIGVAAPFLDLLLAVGDRVSRIAEPQDYEYYPVRAGELPGEQRRDTASGD